MFKPNSPEVLELFNLVVPEEMKEKFKRGREHERQYLKEWKQKNKTKWGEYQRKWSRKNKLKKEQNIRKMFTDFGMKQ
jgi:hypothetical protein